MAILQGGHELTHIRSKLLRAHRRLASTCNIMQVVPKIAIKRLKYKVKSVVTEKAVLKIQNVVVLLRLERLQQSCFTNHIDG